MSGGLGPVVVFGDFRLDAQRRILSARATGAVVPLSGRPFQTLLQFLERPGGLISKAELMAAVWPDVHVEDNSLSQCVSALRKALGEEPGENRYVATEPGRGYRFVAEVAPDRAEAGQRASGRTSGNPQAYQFYVSGWLALTRPGVKNLERGLLQLEKAVLLDPDFALAHVCLAHTCALMGVFGFSAPSEVYPRACAAALKARAINDNLAEAHAALGHIQAVFELDYAAAEASYRRALALDPYSGMAHHFIGLLLLGRGGFDAALDHLRAAQAEEPLAANISANIGLVHYYAGRYHEAIAHLHATLDLDASFAHAQSLLGRCLLQIGDLHGAMEQFKTRSGPTLGSAADIPRTLALMGEMEAARDELAALLAVGGQRYVSPYDIATIHMALGQRHQALDALEAAAAGAAQPINFVKVDPVFSSLRGDARYLVVLQALGLQ